MKKLILLLMVFLIGTFAGSKSNTTTITSQDAVTTEIVATIITSEELMYNLFSTKRIEYTKTIVPEVYNVKARRILSVRQSFVDDG